MKQLLLMGCVLWAVFILRCNASPCTRLDFYERTLERLDSSPYNEAVALILELLFYQLESRLSCFGFFFSDFPAKRLLNDS